MKLRWLLIGLVAMLAACAAPRGSPVPDTWVADSNNGELVIYRTRSFVFSARNTYFYVDGVHAATLGSGNYSLVKVPPGAHRVSLKWDLDMLMKEIVIDVPVPPQQTRYVRLMQSGGNTVYSSPTVMTFNWHLAGVPENVARAEMQELGAKPPINTASR